MLKLRELIKNRKKTYKESKQKIEARNFSQRMKQRFPRNPTFLGKYRFISLAKSCCCLKLFHCSWQATHYLRDSIPDFSGFGSLDNSPKNLSLKCPRQAWPGYQAYSSYSSGTIAYYTTVSSTSSLVEESSNKLKVQQSQLKLMLKTPGQLIAVLWEKINSPSLIAVRESPGRYFFYTSVLSAFRYVPHYTGKRSRAFPWVPLHRVVYTWKPVFLVLSFSAPLITKTRRGKKLLFRCPLCQATSKLMLY